MDGWNQTSPTLSYGQVTTVLGTGSLSGSISSWSVVTTPIGSTAPVTHEGVTLDSISDFNGDGHPDIVLNVSSMVSEGLPSSFEVILGNGTGSFSQPSTTLNMSCTAGNFMGTGQPVCAGITNTSSGAPLGLYLLPNVTSNSNATQISVGGLLADDYDDFAYGSSGPPNVVTYDGSSWGLAVSSGGRYYLLANDGNGNFSAPVQATTDLTGNCAPPYESGCINDIKSGGANLESYMLFSNGETGLIVVEGHSIAVPTTTTVSSSNASVYDGASVTFTATVSSASGTPTGTVTFLADGNSIGSASLSGGSASVSSSNLTIGTHSITASYAGSGAFSASVGGPITQTITLVPTGITASLTASASATSSVPMSFTVSATNGQVPNGTVAVAADGSTALCTVGLSGGSGSCAESALHPGSHTITFNYEGTTEYASSSVSKALLVNAVTTAIGWAPPAAITYGTALSGAQLNATESPSTAGTFTYTPTSGTVLAAGSHTLSVTFSPSDSTDYTPASGSVALTVNKALLTVYPASASRVYGAANPNFTAGFAGYVNNDFAVSGTAACTTTATPTSPVGTYPITCSMGSLTAANYNFSFAPVAQLTITPAPLTITATSESKTYGATASLSAFTASGLLNGDTVTGATFASPGAAAAATVGNYPITVSAATGPRVSNYSITYVPATLTVLPAPLAITPNAQAKTYGDALVIPPTAFTVTGLLNADTVTGLLMASPGTDPAAGVSGSPYTIAASEAAGSGLSNYSITYNTALLTVKQRNTLGELTFSPLTGSVVGSPVNFNLLLSTGGALAPVGETIQLFDGGSAIGSGAVISSVPASNILLNSHIDLTQGWGTIGATPPTVNARSANGADGSANTATSITFPGTSGFGRNRSRTGHGWNASDGLSLGDGGEPNNDLSCPRGNR